MTDSTQVDFDRIKSEIFKLAEMKYECCTYDENPQKTAFRREYIPVESCFCFTLVAVIRYIEADVPYTFIYI